MLRIPGRRVAAVLATLAIGLVTLAPASQAAPSPTTGLYGAADPTYDGVFRQSLAIMGLTGANITPAPSAITWLLGQQCANGAFEGYRADLTTPCGAADPVNFTGPDTNSTAMAALAYMSLLSDAGNKAMSASVRKRVVAGALRAIAWLGRQQNRDGGWPWTTGGASDANSTGLVLAALLSQAANEPFPAYTSGVRYLGSLSFECARGAGLAYQTVGAGPNALATAQALVGISGTLPVPRPTRVADRAPCANTAKAKAASYLDAALGEKGSISSALGDGPDISGTAWAVLALVSSGRGRLAITRGTSTLQASAPDFTTHSGGPDAGALGLLLLVAKATGNSPTSFGGVNLVRLLAGSIRK